jgi:DNA replication protein DnaD
MQGWVKLHRKILDSDVFKNASPQRAKILITLMLLANHKGATLEIDGKEITLEAGQFISSVNKIVEKAGRGITKGAVREALKALEKAKFLTKKATRSTTRLTTKGYTLITICNYASYQGLDEVANTHNNTLSNNKQEVKEIKNTNKGYKEPLSFLFRDEMLKQEPNLFIDPAEDLKRLNSLSYKIKNLMQDRKKQKGAGTFKVTDKESLTGFKHFLTLLSIWERENRFFPEYLLSNFSSIVNKGKKKADKEKPTKLSKDAFKKYNK